MKITLIINSDRVYLCRLGTEVDKVFIDQNATLEHLIGEAVLEVVKGEKAKTIIFQDLRSKDLKSKEW